MKGARSLLLLMLLGSLGIGATLCCNMPPLHA
jgi:hypothetical protein